MTTLSVADARANLSKLVDSASTTHERFEVTRNGRRVAVVLGADDFDSLVETIDILSDPEGMRDLQEGLRSLSLGEGVSVEQVREELSRERQARA